MSKKPAADHGPMLGASEPDHNPRASRLWPFLIDAPAPPETGEPQLVQAPPSLIAAPVVDGLASPF